MSVKPRILLVAHSFRLLVVVLLDIVLLYIG